MVVCAAAAARSLHTITPAEIQDHLYPAQAFKYKNVDVAYQDGVATLTGSEDSIGVKIDAERSVNDVEQVTDQITLGTKAS